ncbi:MAG: hypothetical protein NVS2B3_00770 [Vulcanimicrobiaceae bacterium]
MDLDLLPAAGVPPAVAAGTFHAYFVYDIADTIDLARLESVGGEGLSRAPLHLRREASAGFIEFATQPIVATFPSESGAPTIRAKLFEYGVLSIRLSLPFAGDWNAFAAFTRRGRSDESLPALAEATRARVVREIASALDEPHEALVEDYFVFQVDRFAGAVDGMALLNRYAGAVARLVLCEHRPIMPLEVAEAMRVHFGYFDDDLAVVQWDTAFVFDRREGADATLDILEFANTQLVELRTYDTRLDAELDTIYALDPKQPTRRFRRRHAQDAADRLRYLIVDIAELTDRSSNALKIIGDAYYARLYRGAVGRLGLKDWQKQIDSKVATVDEMYRFFTDQAAAARSEFLEVVIIALIVVEIAIALFAFRR